MKQKLAVILLGMIVLAMVVGVVMASASNELVSTGLEGRVLGILYIDKTSDVVDSLSKASEAQRADMAQLGWVETDTRLEREGGLPNVAVSVGDHKTTTDENGYFKITSLPEGNYVLIVDFEGEVLTTQSVIIQKGVLRAKNIYAHEVNVLQHHCNMEKNATSSVDNKFEAAGKKKSFQYLPCYDCNGPWGDCGSPSHVISNSGGLNFILSDCDRAFFAAGCWRDFTAHPYCNGSRNCSPVIGHSTIHHCH